MKHIVHALGILLFAVVAAPALVMADDAHQPLALADFSGSQLLEQIKPSSADVTVERVEVGGAGAALVKIKPDKDAYPGVWAKPVGAEFWNLLPYGHVEAKVTNTGEKPLRITLRIDNKHSRYGKAMWNYGMATIQPGQTQTLRAFFGFSFGGVGYTLQPIEVQTVGVFIAKPDEPCSYRIESLVAAGQPDEVPPGQDYMLRHVPVNGVVLGDGVQWEQSGECKTENGANVALNGSAAVITFPADRAGAAVTFKPKTGRWNMRDGNSVAVELKNTGSASCTPAVRVDADGGPIQQISPPIAPGSSRTVIVSFLTDKPWLAKSEATGKEQQDPITPGTGTTFRSDKVKAVTVINPNSQAATLTVESIKAHVQVAEIPDWLGKRPPVEGEWVQTLDENFNGPLDKTRWNDTGPNYYDSQFAFNSGSVLVQNGSAIIRAEKRISHDHDNPNEPEFNYSVGYLDTLGKWTQRYGYFECRIKVPTQRGFWPAFWLMPDRGADIKVRKQRLTTSNGGMEFDIMENLAVHGPYHYNIALHWDEYGPDHKKIGVGTNYVMPDKDGYITPGLLWLPGQAIFYCNGVELGRWENPRISAIPSYILFTMPIGGWDGNMWDGQGLPVDWTIDYVRAWQRSDLMNSKEPAPAQ